MSSKESQSELPTAPRMADPYAPLAGGEADYRALANALPHIVWLTEADGRPAWVNQRWYEFTGLSEHETYQYGVLAAVHPDDFPEIERARHKALSTASACEVEYRIRHRDGAYRWHLSRAVPVRNADGSVKRWIAAVLDMHDRRMADQAARAWERQFEAGLNLIPQATAVVRRRDGVHLQINDAFSRLTGFTRDEMIGQSAVTLGVWTSEERLKHIAPLATPPGGSTVMPLRRKDGSALRLAVSSTLIEFDGEPCMIIVGVDVTHLEGGDAALRLSEAQARARADELAALMDAVPAAVWFSNDADCRDVRGNRAAYELLHVRAGENMNTSAMKRRFTYFIDGKEVPIDQLPLERAARGEELPIHAEEVHFHDGEVRHLYGSAVPLRDATGAPRGAMGAYVDVTRLKEEEAALREENRRKDTFLALLSHELRNPLTPILTAAQLLKLRADAEAQIDLDIIVRQVRHLVHIVDDLMDVSSVARGKLTLAKRRIELATVVAKAVEVSRPILETHGHRLEVAVPLTGLSIDADEVRLTQVVNNLLANAARYTPPGGTVVVTAVRERDEVVLRVRDSGIGIEPSLIPRMFDLFVQGQRSPDRAPGGLGVGLWLVRSLTELHGGTMTAHSEGPGRGSEFVVRLPVAASVDGNRSIDGGSDVATTRESSSLHTRVLLVDNDDDVLHAVARLVSAMGFETRTARDARSALALADAFRPQVAILDIGLPVTDGYTLARELRTRLGDESPRLIALTGYTLESDRQRSRQAGFALHLAKPVDADELIQALYAMQPS